MRHDLRRVRQRIGIFARHGLGAHRGAGAAGIDHDDADRRVLHLLGIGSRQRLERRLGDRVGAPEGGRVAPRRSDMKSARPASLWRSSGSSERMSRQFAVTLTAITSSQTFGGMCPSGESWPSMPALARSTSSLPQRSKMRRAEPVDAVEILEIERNQRSRAAGRADLVVEFLQPADGARDGDRHARRPPQSPWRPGSRCRARRR